MAYTPDKDMQEVSILKKNRVKILYSVYALMLSSLAVGWYPEDRNCFIAGTAADVKVMTENLCLLEENQGLFRQGVRATEPGERNASEHLDETSRRQAKAVKPEVKYHVKGLVLDQKDRQILERIVEAEAGDQSVKGRILVANVVINRIKSKEFPDTVRGVVFESGQFSPVSNGSYYRVKISDKTKEAVRRMLKGADYSEGALYFMYRAGSTAANVAWFDRDLSRLFRYGCHEFFR